MSPHNTTNAGGLGSTSGTALMMTDEPAHVRHFLQDTPQLRFLRGTLDMNAAEPALRLFGTAPTQKMPDYQRVRLQWKHHQRAAAELANLMWTLSHEMSLEDYGTVESKVFSRIFAMVHNSRSMAGLAALTALLDAPSADEERRCIKFAYTLSQALRNGAGDFEFLQATAIALGRMAQLASNVDFGKNGHGDTVGQSCASLLFLYLFHIRSVPLTPFFFNEMFSASILLLFLLFRMVL